MKAACGNFFFYWWKNQIFVKKVRSEKLELEKLDWAEILAMEKQDEIATNTSQGQVLNSVKVGMDVTLIHELNSYCAFEKENN